MKSLARKISVLALVGLFAVSLVLAEDCATTASNENAESNVEETRAYRKALHRDLERKLDRKRLDDEAFKERREVDVLSKYTRALGTRPQSRRVLIIPAAQSTADQFLVITEDMSIMSQILDEKLGQSPRAFAYTLALPSYPGYPIFHGSGVTESVYLDGYGALFLMRVDFPLSPPAQEPEDEKPEEGVDPVWQQAKRKIFEPEEGGKFRRRGPARKTRPEKKYEAEKVEELKRKLTNGLKHAANIRSLQPNDLVILSVTGSGQPGNVAAQARVLTSPGGQIIVTSKSGDRVETRVYSDPEEAHAAASASRIATYSPTVMTFRVRKVDVDAFSEGEMDFDTFHRKVQIFTH
jgi:hypothetical protein